MNSIQWFNLPKGEFLRRWYVEQYSQNAYGSTSGLIQNWMHRSLERGYTSDTFFNRCLELGGNTGEHVPYVRHSFSEYLLTDIVDNRSEADSVLMSRRKVTFKVEDACALTFPDETFDRVVNTCLLHHLSDSESALAEIRRVLAVGGTADIFLSSDPGLMFRMARKIGPTLQAKKIGLGEVKKLVDARDHVGHIGGIRRLILHVFRNDLIDERVYPLNVGTWNSSLWHTFRVTRSG